MQGRRLNRSLGSVVCSTTELRPLVVSNCRQESIVRTAISILDAPPICHDSARSCPTTPFLNNFGFAEYHEVAPHHWIQARLNGFFGFYGYGNAICTRMLQGESRLRAEVHAPSVALAPIASALSPASSFSGPSTAWGTGTKSVAAWSKTEYSRDAQRCRRTEQRGSPAAPRTS